VVLGVLPAAKVLMAEMSGVTAVAPGDPLPSFDIQAPLLSLPYLLKTRIDTIGHPHSDQLHTIDVLPVVKVEFSKVPGPEYAYPDHATK